MGFNPFYVQVAVRLLALIATCIGITWVFQLQGYWIVKVNLVFFLIFQVYLFFHYLTRWRRDLQVFAASVKHEDYSITFKKDKKSQAYNEMYDMLNDVSSYARRIKSEHVRQNQYFQYMVENAQVGMVAYDDMGNVLLSNREALEIAGVSELKRMDQLRSLNRELYENLDRLALNRPKLIVIKGSVVQKISARLSRILVDEKKNIYLLSLLNIRNELEENELRSWQDLINVLTHEIMNSITPINSLTGSMLKYLVRIEGNEETVKRAQSSLEVIGRRSQALMEFVTRYRAISNVPLPRLQQADMSVIIESVLTLLEPDLANVDVKVIHHDEKINVDISQIEQVLINLLRNSVQAMEGVAQKRIEIEVTRVERKTTVSVTDNGKGINPDILDKIFIPFYTTRREGSGIGLTLSKQIMHRHGGFLEVVSVKENGATFRLIFTES